VQRILNTREMPTPFCGHQRIPQGIDGHGIPCPLLPFSPSRGEGTGVRGERTRQNAPPRTLPRDREIRHPAVVRQWLYQRCLPKRAIPFECTLRKGRRMDCGWFHTLTVAARLQHVLMAKRAVFSSACLFNCHGPITLEKGPEECGQSQSPRATSVRTSCDVARAGTHSDRGIAVGCFLSLFQSIAHSTLNIFE